ncbi:MAG: hypothetical protein K1X67_26625 [Fimbriimonadaceae bacterium]|nr:hypothetical protein [Fimbriimonadaceae bacterium]
MRKRNFGIALGALIAILVVGLEVNDVKLMASVGKEALAKKVVSGTCATDQEWSTDPFSRIDYVYDRPFVKVEIIGRNGARRGEVTLRRNNHLPIGLRRVDYEVIDIRLIQDLEVVPCK